MPVCGEKWMPVEFRNGWRRCTNCCHYEEQGATPERRAEIEAESRRWMEIHHRPVRRLRRWPEMAIKIETENPVSQTVDAVRELLSYMHRPAEPLPEFVELNDRVRLTLSKDGKAYYLTTARACSCPANTFHPGQRCKHMRALQPQSKSGRMTASCQR